MRQVRLPQSRAGHREGVDRVRLAVGAGALAGVGADPGADPQDRLACGHQEALEAAVDVAAVLEGKAGPLLLAELVRPGEQASVAVFSAGDGQLAEQLPGRVLDR